MKRCSVGKKCVGQPPACHRQILGGNKTLPTRSYEACL